MNNRDSHIYFKVVLDKNAEGIAFGGCPAFLPEEIDLFLNQAQLEILSNKITGNNALRVGLEGNLSNISELDKLLTTDQNIYAYHTQYNEFVADDIHKDGERMTILSIQLKYSSTLQANCGITDHDTVKLFKQTYNNTPWVENPVAALEDNKVLVYVDPILMQDSMYAPRFDNDGEYYRLDVTYVKRPTKFDYSSPDGELDFPEDVMYEIINRAVVIALENIESQRQTTKLQLNQLSE